MSVSLDDIRKDIDAADDAIVPLLVKRMELAAKIGEYKAARGLPVHDPARERAVIGRLTAGMDERTAACVEAVYQTLFGCSRSVQEELRKG